MNTVQFTVAAWLLAASVLLFPGAGMAGDPVIIEGTLTESGSGDPLPGVTVVVSDTGLFWAGSMVAEATTGASGEYSLSIEMEPGQTRDIIVEAAGPNHAPGRYNGLSDSGCFFNCGGDSGTFSVSAGDTLSDVDFQLEPGGTLAGTISDAGTGSGLENAYVEPIRSDGGEYSQHFRADSGQSGDYQLPLALPAGAYHLRAGPAWNDNYVIQAWQGFPCQHSRCPILNTDTVDLSAGGIETDIDFALQPGAVISGTLGPAADLVRISRLYDGTGGFHLDQRVLLAGEAAWQFDGLVGGSYYLEVGPALPDSPYMRKLHNGLPCPFGGCNRARGAPLTVQSGGTLADIDLILDVGGTVGGTIIDGDTQASPAVTGPSTIVGSYNVIDAAGNIVGGGNIAEDDGEVVLRTSHGIPPGDYYVRTFEDWLGSGVGYNHPRFGNGVIEGFSDAVYPDVPCAGQGCDLGSATPITINENELTEITLEIRQGSNVSGTIIDQGTSDPIPDALIKLVDAQNRMLAVTYTDELGAFAFGAFPAGDYYLRTAMSAVPGPGHVAVFQNAYFDRIHGAAARCSELLCDPATATAISLDGSSDAGPFTLAVESGPVIRGQIIDASTGLPINGGHIELFDDQGNRVGDYKVNRFTSFYQTTALEPGTYTLNPVVSPAYNAVLPPSSSPSSASPLVGSNQQGEATPATAGNSVTIGEEDVQANTQVVDTFFDKVFQSDFMQ